jgi:hypothetical protein
MMTLSEAGRTLDATLNSMEVERLWLAGEYVYWETGKTMPTPPPLSEGYEKDTHCSAFAAAVARKLGVPLLSPLPEAFLANKQAEWLEGLPEGWQSVSGPVEAQRLANEGHFVLISYLNPNDGGSGHIEIVRAHVGRSDDELALVGPQVIQAGKINFNSTTAAEGFSSGYAADYPSYPWPHHVKYYAHRL